MNQNFLIGIAGGSGSGKSTAVERICRALRDEHYTLISHDNYYKDQSKKKPVERKRVNYDHPNALETDLLVKHLKMLKQGQEVRIPKYDFVTHTRKKTKQTVSPSKIVVVEGILLFENQDLRNLFDLKIFVDTPDDIRFIRRLQRDIEHRGRDMESVIEQYLTTVRPMHLEFVEPSKRYADVIMLEGGKNQVALDLFLARIHSILQE